MIHEILFSLTNCPGYLFQQNEENGTLEWKTPLEWQEFFHPAEYTQVQRIMKIALRYHRIVEFQKSVMNRHTTQCEGITYGDINGEAMEITPLRSGLYLQAFCNGLSEVLDVYRRQVDHLEIKFLQNPQLTLVYILGVVEKYTSLFQMLQSMICTMETERAYGCLLISKLHKYRQHGNPQITLAANKILTSINAIFYRTLANWMIYGKLVDVYNEFFIQDCKCDDENFLFPEQLEAAQSEHDRHSRNVKKSRVRKSWRVHKYAIRVEMLPSFVPLEEAETILFIGRTVWILQNDPNKSWVISNEQSRRDVWEGKSVDYYKKIHDLDNSFDLLLFKTNINKCRLKLTEYLWKVMVEEAKFLEHLVLIRDYYALGRGELFQQFIVASEEQMKLPPSDHVANNLNSIFHETARKLYGENDSSYMKFELTMSKNTEINNDAVNQLLYLELYLDVNWPLHIIFHPKVIASYNKLFSFLMRVRKTHINLHQLWLHHLQVKNKMNSEVWHLRHSLMFLVNNIQYYLQVDVIDSQFSFLQEAIKTTNEFSDIIRLHSTFLSNLLSRTFVMVLDQGLDNTQQHGLYQLPAFNFESKNMVYNIILLLLELCDEFCLISSTWEDELTELESKTFEEIRLRSDTIIETLLRALYSLHKQVSNLHILQLLNRLDFNRMYSKSKLDFNLTVS